MAQFFIRYRGQITGPFPTDTVLSQMRSGRISGVHEVSSDGTSWLPLSRMEAVVDSSGRERLLESAEAAAARAAMVRSMASAEAANYGGSSTVTRDRPDRTRAAVFDPDGRWPSSAGVSNELAITGFICSLVGFCIGPIALVGLVLSAMAMSRPGKRGFAIAGLVIGIVGVLGWVVAVAAMV